MESPGEQREGGAKEEERKEDRGCWESIKVELGGELGPRLRRQDQRPGIAAAVVDESGVVDGGGAAFVEERVRNHRR